MDRRAFMRSLAALTAAGGAAACAPGDLLTGPRGVLQPTGADLLRMPRRTPINVGLRDIASARGLDFGCGVDWRAVFDVPLLDAHGVESGMVVPVAQGHWDDTHPTLTTWDFQHMDGLWQVAQYLNLPMRGTHTLHHADLPEWFYTEVNSSNALQVMRDHISAFMGRYVGMFHSWNPVNEAVFPIDGRKDGLRNSPWLQMLGPGYIAEAFNWAAQVDPSATLVLNEFGLETDSTYGDDKRKAMLKVLTVLKNNGVPIHALGMQGHLDDKTKLSPTKITSFLDSVHALGLKVFITELDVSDQFLPADIPSRDRVIADKYHEYLSIVLPHPAVTTLITWGLSDRICWLKYKRPRGDGLPVRVMPLDDNLMRKEAWLSIAQALRGQ